MSLRFLRGVYSRRFPFPKSPFWILVSCTFMMTEPSLRCRLTFLPRKDLALFRLKLSILFFHQSASLSAMLVQHCLHMGSFSPLIMM